MKVQQRQQQQEGDFDDLRPIGVVVAAMIALAGFMATRETGPIPYIGWAFVLAGLGAIIRELTSYGTIGYNLVALALAIVPFALWHDWANRFESRSLFREMALLAIVVYIGRILIKSRRSAEEIQDKG